MYALRSWCPKKRGKSLRVDMVNVRKFLFVLLRKTAPTSIWRLLDRNPSLSVKHRRDSLIGPQRASGHCLNDLDTPCMPSEACLFFSMRFVYLKVKWATVKILHNCVQDLLQALCGQTNWQTTTTVALQHLEERLNVSPCSGTIDNRCGQTQHISFMHAHVIVWPLIDFKTFIEHKSGWLS